MCCLFTYCHSLDINDISIYLSLFSGVFTIVITILYFTKPNIRIVQFYLDERMSKKKDATECDNKRYKLKVVIVNCNRFFDIVDIKCEMILSKTKDFDKTKTLVLVKEHTLSLSNKDLDNYTFVSNEYLDINNEIDTEFVKYEYAKVKLIAPNILGIKKVKTHTIRRGIYLKKTKGN